MFFLVILLTKKLKSLTIDVCAKVYFADIIIAEHCRVTSVGCVVGSTVVEGTASRKCQASIQAILIDHLPRNAL